MRAQSCGDVGIADAHAGESTCRAPSPRSNGTAAAISAGAGAWRSGPSSGEHGHAHAWCIGSSGRQERDTLTPAGLRGGLEREAAASRGRSSMQMPPRIVTARNDLVGVEEARTGSSGSREKFGDGAEGAEAPLRIGVGYLPRQQIDGCGAHRSQRERKRFRHEKAFSRAMPRRIPSCQVRTSRSGDRARTGHCGQKVAPAFTRYVRPGSG